ncbi:MAG: DUF4271 domain-containing protein [Bacteroidales bacterium]|jgi:hypothetical protein|nr:DUF4271 domain-containing protein [Bacteroidales bacterium]
MGHDCVGRQKYEKNAYFYGKIPGFYMQDTLLHTVDTTQASAVLLMPPVNVTTTTAPAYPFRHDGLLRPVSTISETFLFSLLLLLLFVLHKVIKTGPVVVWDMVRNLLFHEERAFTRESLVKNNLFVLWPINLFLVSFGAYGFLQVYQQERPADTWLFWKLALFTLLFLTTKHLIYRLVAYIFFTPDLVRRWLQGNQVMLTAFSVSLIPLLLLNEMGVTLPLLLLYAWPVAFLVIPRMAYAYKGLNFFLLGHGGYFYMILYLCALEILPLLLFFKGIFLIQ